MIDTATLKAIDLFSQLKDEHLEVLTKNLRPLHMDADEVLITELSETRAPLFVVTKGKLEVSRKDSAGNAHPITTLDPPTVVGELEFLADVQSSASVRAIEEVEGLLLPRNRFTALFEAGEPVAYHLALAIARVVSRRLSDTNILLIKALAHSPERLERVSNAQFDANALSRIDDELQQLLE